jgi:hypothetical protein
LPILDMKEMGIGLAVAVLIDATIVRAVLRECFLQPALAPVVDDLSVGQPIPGPGP